jgi:hypothetical protein
VSDNWLDVKLGFNESGKIDRVDWSDGTYDIWTYHELTKQEEKLHAQKKLSKAVVARIGKENLKKQSDGHVFKMIYDEAGTLLRQELQK